MAVVIIIVVIVVVTILIVTVIMMMKMIPIAVTLVGIVTDGSAVHDLKAASPGDNDDNDDSN